MSEDILSLIKSRRSIRRYENRPIPPTLIDSLLDHAIWAPSAHNRQPWRFAVFSDFATKDSLASAMGTRLRHDLTADNVPEAVIEKDVSRSYDRITNAPSLILICLSMEDMDSYSDERRNQNEYLMAVQSTAMATQNLLLAAHAKGLGACWMCAPLFVPNLVRDTLSLPADWQPQGLITLGYPAQTRTKQRIAAIDRSLHL